MTGSERIEITQPLEDWAEGLVDRAVARCAGQLRGEMERHLDGVVSNAVALGIERHMNTCPVRDRVQRIEVKLSSLIGFMIGSGVLGGGTGVLAAKLLGL